jgi:hypothetical protein
MESVWYEIKQAFDRLGHVRYTYTTSGKDKEKALAAIFNVAPCMLLHLLYNPTHALFTL